MAYTSFHVLYNSNMALDTDTPACSKILKKEYLELYDLLPFLALDMALTTWSVRCRRYNDCSNSTSVLQNCDLCHSMPSFKLSAIAHSISLLLSLYFLLV